MTRTTPITVARWLWLLAALTLLAAGCTGTIGDAPTDAEDGGPTSAAGFTPAPATIHRLTSVQLINSYRALFGEPLDAPADLPDDDQLYGFANISAASTTISPLDAEQYEAAAYATIDQVWLDGARREALVGCVPADMNDPCARDFLDSFGKRAWRRPLSNAEIDTLIDLGRSISADLADSWQGLRFTLAAVLQSPHFLFRVEIGEPDEESGHYRFTSWEMASRLSYLITDGPPDEQLMAAAEQGALDDPTVIRFHAGRLVEADSARPALVRFFRDFMNIGRLDELDKSTEEFPMFTATLGPAMRLEIERMFENTVFDNEGDFRQLFTSRETFVNDELAQLYGIDPVGGSELQPLTLPADGKRAGLLTTAGFLAMNAHKTETSPTHRGRFVRVNLLCQDVPPPPPGVETTLPEPEPGAPQQTLRERLDAHRTDPACAPCHEQMDPIGFGLEDYDATGAWRDTDQHGLAIDSATELDGTPFEGGVELGEIVATLPEVGRCIAERFYQHAGGHLNEAGERPAVEALVEAFTENDFNFKRLVIELVVNDGFRYAADPNAEEE